MTDARQKWVVCPNCGSQNAWANVEPARDTLYSNVTFHCPDCDSPNRKHTTGTINDYEFILRVDGDAPDKLVAEIESALADVKAEVENDG